MAENGVVTLLPVRPAPAAPKRDAMTAMPAVDPKAAAPALPMIVAAPAATRGAARPPVRPEDAARDITKLLSLKNPRQAFLCAGRMLLLLLEELFACPIKRLCETLPRPWFSAQILWLTADKWRIISKSKEDYVVIWGELCSVCSGNIDLISHFWFQSWRSDPLIIWQQKRRKHF